MQQTSVSNDADLLQVVAPALKHLTKKDVAARLEVSERTVEMWTKAGTLPAPSYFGRQPRWHPAVFEAWLDRKLRGECDEEAAKTAPLLLSKSASTPRLAPGRDIERMKARDAERLKRLTDS